MNHAFMLFVGAAASCVLGCAGVGTGSLSIPGNARATCQEQCTEMGMSLSAMVTMAGSVGCVCEPTAAPTTAETASPATVGGMAAIVGQQKARETNPQ